jgi:hypothetical protein
MLISAILTLSWMDQYNRGRVLVLAGKITDILPILPEQQLAIATLGHI